MGVTGLWTVVQPCARPTKIETLNKKRLAIDASIWIYQFLKAVRGKDGESLRNSHIVGFFQRICKLLFFGIKPVFVFDGGAPALKRQTINARRARREGRREDAVRTAGKLLALQMQRRAEEEEQRRTDEASGRRHTEQEEPIPENLVYVDELQMTAQERQRNRTFRKKDAYHLPDLDTSISEMGQPNDPRVMSLEELEQYARQFDSAEDINVYDFSKIDFDGPFFMSLPATDRYNILNAARLRSRLRMGLSKDQLDTMFPDRMAFSRFQIERVRERNELTQRLMHVNGMVEDIFGVGGTGRIAGEKGREYVLVRNAGVEGGWALGVIGDKDEGERNKPIDVDSIEKQEGPDEEESEWEDEDAFEDVPIEGLNRLPKRTKTNGTRSPTRHENLGKIGTRKRNIPHDSQEVVPNDTRSHPGQISDDPNSLFLAEEIETRQQEDDNDDEELSRAIAMSLEKDPGDQDDWEEVFHQSRADEAKGFPVILPMSDIRIDKNLGRCADPPKKILEDSDEDEMDLQGALKESRVSKRQTSSDSRVTTTRPQRKEFSPLKQTMLEHNFDGPLPFEKLDLGSSLLGKKKMKKLAEDRSGGFEKPDSKVEKSSAPLPPWFSGDIKEGLEAQEELQAEHREQARVAEEEEEFEFLTRPRLRKQDTTEIIDIDADPKNETEVISLDSPANKDTVDNPTRSVEIVQAADKNLDMVNVEDEIREPPEISLTTDKNQGVESRKDSAPNQIEESEEEVYEWEDSDREENTTHNVAQNSDVDRVRNDSRPGPTKSSSPEFENVAMSPDHTTDQDFNNIHTLEQPLEDTLAPEHLLVNDESLEPDSDDQDFFSDPEEDELMQQLAIEAEEHARFASTLNNKSQRQNVEDYERELKALRSQQKKDRRDADEVTHIMVTECQQLLTLFGLPYITAPMEAEAQCAELVRLGLVDGIVTDDSDIFLFGGTRVYKNMFNAAKFVECYLATDLEREFDLTRQKLIDIAQLLGSDYTEGLPGIGPVTALELLSEFGDLASFSAWWTQLQTTGTIPQETTSPLRRKLRKQTAKLFLPPSFPNTSVTLAYLQPAVDRDPSAFAWGVPDLDALRSFLMATIGWSPARTDEVLVPVIRDMNRRAREGTQANISAFVEGGAGTGTVFAPRRRAGGGGGSGAGKSRRMETALEKLAERARGRTSGQADASAAAVNGDRNEEDLPTAAASTKRPSSKTNASGGRQSKRAASQPDEAADDDDDNDESDYRASVKKARKKKKRGEALNV